MDVIYNHFKRLILTFQLWGFFSLEYGYFFIIMQTLEIVLLIIWLSIPRKYKDGTHIPSDDNCAHFGIQDEY